MRLIDADALLDRLMFKRMGSMQRNTYPGLESAIAQCEKAPTIDAVSVVRCSECKHAQHIDDEEPMYICLNPKQYSYCSRGSIVCESMHYCGYGERKGDAE